MSVITIGLDLAKTVFQVHGVDASGRAVLRRRLGREGIASILCHTFSMPNWHGGMLERTFTGRGSSIRFGHDVRLIPPQYAKPYVKRNKTDAADAEAICEAVARPNMRFVPIKTREQQSVLALHRVRALLVRQRTATINALRGLLCEFGIVASKGSSRIVELRGRVDKSDADLLPQEAREGMIQLFDRIDDLRNAAEAVEARILIWHKNNEASQRLASAPGVGPITASAIVATVGDGNQFKSARHFAAWLGLTPRISASGGKERIREDQQRRRSLSAHVANPRCTRRSRDNVPQECHGTTLAYCSHASPAR